MLLVDERIGSRDLLHPLQQAGVPCELQYLEFADFAFVGRGMHNADIHIGIELKETRDLVSSMFSARFSGHQLPGLQTQYDRAWLLTEGIWRTGEGGVLEVMAGGWKPVSIGSRSIMACDLESWILTQTIRGGISHWHASTRKDTIRFLTVLYKWWTDKSLEEHRSHQAIYTAPPDRASVIEATPFMKAISGLVDGIGWEKAISLENLCGGSLRRLVGFTVRDLQAADGIGKTIAARIDTALGSAPDNPQSGSSETVPVRAKKTRRTAA